MWTAGWIRVEPNPATLYLDMGSAISIRMSAVNDEWPSRFWRVPAVV